MPFLIVRNDITKMDVDAIVNPANPMPQYGDGIDSAVYHAAGEKALLEERQKIGSVLPGTSFVTSGGNLPAKHIIHTVSTAWEGGGKGEEEVLRSCYRSSFKLAAQLGIASVAFPLLASGSYGFPKDVALNIAVSEIHDFLSENEMSVYLVVFDRKSFLTSGERYGDIDSYIDENYVEEVNREEYRDRRRLFESAASCNKLGRPFEKRPRAGRKASDKQYMAMLSMDLECLNEPDEALEEVSEEVPEEALEEGLGQVPKKAQEKSARTLEEVIVNLDKNFMELVFTFADQRDISDVELQKRANLDKRTYSKLKCGTTKKPSQTTALALAIGLRLNLDETKDLLSRAGLALSPCSKLDLIVKYFIEREVYDIDAINIALFDHGEPLLGSQTT